jgi:hypothetical protein
LLFVPVFDLMWAGILSRSDGGPVLPSIFSRSEGSQIYLQVFSRGARAQQ